MLKRIVNYLKNNRIDCHTDKSARNDRVCHYGRFAFYRKFAFTLAETLIVMGIIGVVAALTLPNLNSSTGEKEKVAKVKKIYQNLNDAFGRAQAVYGPVNEWCNNYSGSCKNRHLERLTEFLKTTKICNSTSICYVSMHEGSVPPQSYSKSAVLADGTLIAIRNTNNGFDDSLLLVDIDGPNKGKNRAGFDIFEFQYGKDKGVHVEDIDRLFLGDNSYVEYNDNIGGTASIATCWVINFGNMDYLKTTDGTTCPDGTKLTFGGNHSCK